MINERKANQDSLSNTDEARGQLLDAAASCLEMGQPFDQRQFAASHGLDPQDVEDDLAVLALLHECAITMWADSDLAEVLGDSLPDPFPGEYRFQSVLGEGAFGKVYLAEDMHLKRLVAIKTLKALTNSSVWNKTLAALRNESQFLAALAHPNIVHVHAWRESQGEHFMILQYVAGETLEARARQGALPWWDAARYVADAGEALVAAHKEGIIHRDIKPDNILWDRAKDEAVLTDFGISARLVDARSIAGTPAYMAPEAFAGEFSPAVDVYSLGASLFRLVAGRLPFHGGSTSELIRQKQTAVEEGKVSCRSIPASIEALIQHSLSADPARRPGIREFIGQLRTQLNQLLADTLPAVVPTPAATPLQVQVMRSTLGSQSLVPTQKALAGSQRDMRRVPRQPASVVLRSGDVVTLQVTSARPGYLALINVGPTGNLNILHSHDGSLPAVPIAAATPFLVPDIVMTPPIGSERVVAIWNARPFSLEQAPLSVTGPGLAQVSPAYRATRDMKRLQQSVNAAPDQWEVAVLELVQQP